MHQIRRFGGDSRVQILDDPQGVGNCQFLSVANQFKKIGIYFTCQQLRDRAVSHLERHKAHYQSFTDGDFNHYLKEMAKDGSYGDHLTLTAMAREFNCQFLVVNALGEAYNRLISNTNVYDRDINVFTLGYYPEDDGEHYVSISLSPSYERSLLQTLDIAAEQQDDVLHEDILSGAESDVTISDNRVDTVSNVEVDRLEVDIERAVDMSPQPDEVSDNVACGSEVELNEDVEVPYLPDLPLEKIIKETIKTQPLMRYTLMRVSRFFQSVVESIGFPSIHISSHQISDVPRIVSVQYLTRRCGSHSGVMLNVRRQLRDAGGRWYRAWLTLKKKENDWYEVRNVTWK